MLYLNISKLDYIFIEGIVFTASVRDFKSISIICDYTGR